MNRMRMALAMRRLVKVVRSAGDFPVIVFASEDYLPVVENWLFAFDASGAKEVVVVALDGRTQQWVHERGVAAALITLGADKSDLWVTRVRVFAALLRAGVSFVHSDADAVWRVDPRKYLSDQKSDLLVSQGTVWPQEAVDRWGFVACAGFFAARSTPATRALFTQILRVTKREQDDQRAINLVLLDQIRAWDFAPDSTYTLDFREKTLRCSSEIVRASTATGIRVGLLPNRLFLRAPEPDTSPAFVHHPVSPKNLARKAQSLAASGDWHLGN